MSEGDIFFNDAFNAELEHYKKFYIDIYTPVLKYLSSIDENILVLFDKIEVGKNVFELAKQIVPSKKAHYRMATTF